MANYMYGNLEEFEQAHNALLTQIGKLTVEVNDLRQGNSTLLEKLRDETNMKHSYKFDLDEARLDIRNLSNALKDVCINRDGAENRVRALQAENAELRNLIANLSNNKNVAELETELDRQRRLNRIQANMITNASDYLSQLGLILLQNDGLINLSDEQVDEINFDLPRANYSDDQEDKDEDQDEGTPQECLMAFEDAPAHIQQFFNDLRRIAEEYQPEQRND